MSTASMKWSISVRFIRSKKIQYVIIYYDRGYNIVIWVPTIHR